MSARQPPRRLVALIACLTIVPIGTLLWQASRLLREDRAAERQQIQQRVDRSADLLMSVIERAIAGSAERLTTGSGAWPAGAVAITFQDGRVTISPPGRVAYLPVVPLRREPSPSLFARADDLELRQQDLPGAAAIFRELAGSPDIATQAGAMLRLGGLLQKTGRVEEALETYEKLSEIEDVSIDGVPMGLIGTYKRATLLESQQRRTELRTLAVELTRDLQSGKWPLTWPVYQTYAADAARWRGLASDGTRASGESEVFSDAVELLWERGNERRAPVSGTSGVESLDIHGSSMIVLTRPLCADSHSPHTSHPPSAGSVRFWHSWR